MGHPLNWRLLTAFEAVARNQSFSRAANELNVQQPAISRRVAELETDLGVPLVRRTRPSTGLTADGEVLYRALAASLVQVQGAVERITSRSNNRPVRVGLTIGFAACYLLTRLGGFHETNPSVDLELVTRDLNAGYDVTDLDVVIVFSAPHSLPGIRQVLFFTEELIAVAAPGYADGGDIPPSNLGDHRLLRLAGGAHGQDWDRFMAGSGGVLPPIGPGATFNSFMVYLQAALNGDGIALGWRGLLDDALTAGRLRVVTRHSVKSDLGYYACLTESGAARAGAITFLDWVGAGLSRQSP